MAPTLARRTRLSAMISLAVVAALGSTVPGAHSAPPVPGGLAAQQTDSTTTVLSWQRARSASHYTVQVDNDSSFGSPEFTTTTANNRAVPHTTLLPGTNYWRVRSVSTSGDLSEWSPREQVAVPDPQTPTLVAPAPRAQLQQPEDVPLLQWSEVPGAKSYKVEIDDASDFIGAQSLTTGITSTMPTEPLAPGTWHWRVTATTTGGILSRPSETRTFTVLQLAAPALVSPVNSPDESVQDVVLDWSPVSGAKYYELEVATNRTFERTDIIDSRTKITGTRYSPPTGYDNDQYYWRVRSVDAAGAPSQWSESRYNFKREWPDRPQPVFPKQSGTNPNPNLNPLFTITDLSPYLQWTPVRHASHYQLQLDTTPGFASPKVTTCNVAGTTYTPKNAVFAAKPPLKESTDEKCRIQEGIVYYWRVRPMDKPFSKDGIQGIYSPTQRFVWDPEMFESVSPENGETDVKTPTFSWKAALPTDQYKIEVRDKNGNRVASGTTYATSWTPVGVKLDPADGPFEWDLTAVAASGEESGRETRGFRLAPEADPVTTSQPPLTALTGIASDAPSMRAPQLSWVPDPDADHYRVWMGDEGTNFYWTPERHESFGKDLHYPTVTDTGTRVMVPGTYYWRVESYDADNRRIRRSSANTVRIADFEEVTGQRIAIDGKTLEGGGGCAATLAGAGCPQVPTTPVFSWDPSSDYSFYGVYVSQDANFTNLTEPKRIPASYSTKYAYTFANTNPTLADNTSGVPYYWHIRPCKTAGVCAPDPVSNSTSLAKNAFRKISPTVQLTSPGNVTVGSTEVTFSWRDYFDSNRATSFAAGTKQEKGNQSAMQYRIRVATDPTFTNLVDNRLVDQPTYTAFSTLYPEGKLYWRVAAVDVSGNELSSSVGSFTKSSAVPTPTTPARSSTVSPTTPFRWSTAGFAGRYEIEVARDAQFSPTKRLFSTKVWTTAYAWTSSLPVGNDYHWRVRQIDSAGNNGAWSPAVRFNVAAEAVQLTSPTAGSIQDANGTMLTWRAVPGAATYKVEVSTAAGKRVESFSTGATAFAPYKAMGSGLHTWSVTALDGTGKTLSTATSSFKVVVDLTALAPPKVTGKARVGSKVTAIAPEWPAKLKTTYQWLRNGKAIKGATAASYTVQLADATTWLQVRATGTATDGGSSTSTSARVKVPKASSTIAAKLSKKSVKRGQKVTVTATLKVATTKSPTGTVQVKRGKKTIKSVKVKTRHKGRITIKLPKSLKKGKHVLRLYFKGTSKINKSKSKKVVLRVK